MASDVVVQPVAPISGQQVKPAVRLAKALSFRKISAVYILILLVAIYSIWAPDTFLTAAVWRSLIASGAITALVAVGLVLPLAAGAFDLAIGAEVGTGAIVVAWLLTQTGLPVPVAMLLTVVIGALIGVVTGLLVTKVRIDSFIATLGMSSVLLAVIAWLSGGQQIANLSSTFQNVATHQILGITASVWIMLVVAVVVWYVLERTSAGRRIYATGGNLSAARLAGVPTSVVIIATLASCGAIAAFAGSLVSSQIATGDPTIGPSYLLPAFAAAFLGSTQFRGGRYNIWGTVLAVYVLLVGVKGLQLGGAPVWIPDLFNGLALLLAVGLSRFQRTASRTNAVRRTLRRTSDHPPSDLTNLSSTAAAEDVPPSQSGSLPSDQPESGKITTGPS